MIRYNKVLFVMEEMPVSEFGEGGGSLVVKNHLDLLCQVFNEVDIVVLRTEYGNYSGGVQVRPGGAIKHVHILNVHYGHDRSPWKTRYLSITQPEYFVFPILNDRNVAMLQGVISESGPQMIWAEHLSPAVLSFHSTDLPVVYSHHDWAYKLRKLREHKTSLRYSFATWQMRRAERQLVRKVAGIISPSLTEAEDCKGLGAENVIYLPVCVTSARSQSERLPGKSIFHFGGMRTTSNRRGLERFFEVCWPVLKQVIPDVELIVVGSLKGATETLLKNFEDKQVKCLGFVENLEDALAPYCINIIPWEYNTGTRTKVPFILRSRQVLVSTAEAIKGYPELINGDNVVTVLNLDEMTDRISSVLADSELVRSVAERAFKTYEEHFTLQTHVDRFRSFVTTSLTS